MLLRSDSTYHHYIHAGYWLTICAGVFIILILLSMVLLYPGGNPDPFTSYAGIMPGQPVTQLSSFGCIEDYPPSSSDAYVCRGKPGDELIFSRIGVLILDGAIKQITFYGNSLQVVDLLRHFGEPASIILEERHYVLRWDDGTYAFIRISARRYANQLRVLFVSLRS